MLKKILALPQVAQTYLFQTGEPTMHATDLNNRTTTTLFILTILFYVAYQLAMQPGWVLGGEMWAEMADNYFVNANAPSYFQKLFSTDAGYIPIPQRLIAMASNLLNLPASLTAYFYTWSAIILTGMMAGSFCLSPFRLLVRSDALRFFTAIAILMTADFETRTFINFTYFAAFFIAIITALALINNTEETPKWSWLIPVLVISKPAVLAALPAMIITATVSKARFRWITITAIILCVGQLIQIAASEKAGVMAQTNNITFLSKALASFGYFFGFLGGYISGPHFHHLNKYFFILIGLSILVVSGLIIFKKRSGANALILVGLSLLFFNMFLNAFALSDSWNTDMARIEGLPLYRHIIVGFFGCTLVIVGLCTNLASYSKLLGMRYAAPCIFLTWFAISGWFTRSLEISREPLSPITKNSQWQKMAAAIDSGISPLCVPVDPLSWMYSRNCAFLSLKKDWRAGGYNFKNIQIENSSNSFFEITPPISLSEKTLVSLAILLKPLTPQTNAIDASAIITLKNGNKKHYAGKQKILISEGLVLLTGKDLVPIKNIATIKFIFSSPVEIAIFGNQQNEVSSVLWMGF